MAVLKDIMCQRCGVITEEMVAMGTSHVTRTCGVCDKKTAHVTRPDLGGPLRTITWGMEGVNPEDYTEVLGVAAGTPRPEDIGTANERKNMTPICSTHTGKPIHDSTRFTDGLEERKKKRRWARERDKYGKKLHFTN